MPVGRILLKSISESKKLSMLKTDSARLLYTWLLPHLNINGCFSADPIVINSRIFTRLNKTIEEISRYLDDIESAGLIKRYQANGDTFLIVPDFAEKQPSLNRDREGKPTIPPPAPEQVQIRSGVVQDLVPLSKVKESKVKESKERKTFIPPSLNELSIYCKERKNNIDPQYFLDYQTARDWKLKGGQKIKDWQAVIRTWEKNSFNKVADQRQEAPQKTLEELIS